jgi:hypothetical protein
MFSKSAQFVSIIKYYNQLKLDVKELVNNDIVKSEQSSFLISSATVPQDVVYKIKALEQNNPQTYVSTLCDSNEYKLYTKTEIANKDEYSVVNLNALYDIALNKSTLFETQYFYEASGLDYIFSPFHILNLHCEQNPSASTLNGLILNNSLYILILNEKNEIVYHSVEALTSFEEIQQSNFYDNEIFGQKLFDEIYYFEIENIIGTVLEKFYESKAKLFIDKVTILHMIKQLNDEQVNTLHKELLIEVNYHPIQIDDYMYELAKNNDKTKNSFSKPRKKEKSKFVMFFLIFLSLLITLSGFYLYDYMQNKKIEVEQENIQQSQERQQQALIKKEEKNKPTLPNHIDKNMQVEGRILNLFDIISYSVVLDEFVLGLDDLTFYASILEDDVYIKTMQPALLKEYKYSTLQYLDSQGPDLKIVVNNSEYIKPAKLNNTLPNYNIREFLPKQRVEEQLKSVLNEHAVISFRSDYKSDITTFNYMVNTLYESPLELFELFDRLNQLNYSINVSYPVSMKRLDEGAIEAGFILQFHQNH